MERIKSIEVGNIVKVNDMYTYILENIIYYDWALCIYLYFNLLN